jgi:hypothetical protein
MIRILLLGPGTGTVIGSRLENEHQYRCLIPDSGIDRNQAEHMGRNRYGNLKNKIRGKPNQIQSFPFRYLDPGLQTEVTGFFPRTSYPYPVGYDRKESGKIR